MSAKRKILVTRPRPQALELVDLLAERGVGAISVPTVEIEPVPASELDSALARLDDADWLVITSVNGANAVLERLRDRAAPLPDRLRIAAVGPATAAALQAGGLRVDHVPDDYLTVMIADGMGEVRGRRVMLARADAATPDLRDVLVARGADVDEVVAYRTIEGPAESRDPLRAALARHLDGVSFTSGSTVRGLMRLASTFDRARLRALGAFCIGPVSADVARRRGFGVAAVAEEHTTIGLADAIAAHFSTEAR
ncbi:MAG: uroporphyrinogen-III synthase [Candidatus Limnocylindria bacterium]